MQHDIVYYSDSEFISLFQEKKEMEITSIEHYDEFHMFYSLKDLILLLGFKTGQLIFQILYSLDREYLFVNITKGKWRKSIVFHKSVIIREIKRRIDKDIYKKMLSILEEDHTTLKKRK